MFRHKTEGRQQRNPSRMELPPDLFSNSASQAMPKGQKASNQKGNEKTRKKRRPPKVPWKKPKDMPKRPLSAYNLFFQHEREQLLQSARSGNGSLTPSRNHQRSSGIGFANLAKTIAGKWKAIDPNTRTRFEGEAAEEKARYTKEMVVWRKKKKDEAEALASREKDIVPVAARSHEPDPVVMDMTKQELTPKRSASLTWPSRALVHLSHPILERRQSDPGPFHHLDDLHRHLEPLPLSPPQSRDHRHVHFGDENWMDTFGTSITSIRSAPEYHEETLQIRQSTGDRHDRTMTDSLMTLQGQHSFDEMGDHDIRSCEDILASTAGEDKHSAPASVFHSSLRSLGSSLDDDTVDFLTNLRFDAL